MIEGLVLLLVFQLLGNVAEMYFHLPVPGSVLGMFLLLVALIANDRLASWVRPISLVLISYLAVLFVPAGVGIMLHIDRLKNEALPIGVSLVVSTILTIAVTARSESSTRRSGCRNAKNGRRQGMNNIDFHGIEEIGPRFHFFPSVADGSRWPLTSLLRNSINGVIGIRS